VLLSGEFQGSVRANRVKQAQEDRADTATQMLDVAERLVQVRGFNAFSYADVAGELGLTNAALHYHFPSKSDLGEALIARYAIRFIGALAEIDGSIPDPLGKLDAYIDLYTGVLRNQRMCLCGMLAAEYETLSAGMQGAITDFFERNERWLAEVLKEGRDDGTLSFPDSPLEEALSIVSALEGAMLIARSIGDIKRFRSAANHVMTALRQADLRTP
jgi:TetR/AcrR family transcriptional regulator, transcriptional repressor for nem operon